MTSTRIFTRTLVVGVSMAAATVSTSAFAQRWDTQPGCMKQMQISANYLFGIGCSGPNDGGDEYIYRLPLSEVGQDSWFRYPTTSFGVQVSAGSDDTPWVINKSGQIFEWVASANTFGGIAGCARSIAVGNDANHDVWVVGCTSTGGGNYVVKKWNGSSWGAALESGLPYGGAVNVSAAPGTTGGVGVVTAQGTVYYWSGSTWGQANSVPTSCVSQISNGSLDMLDCSTNLWDWQYNAQNGGSWVAIGNPAASVTGDPNYSPYVFGVATGGEICYISASPVTSGSGWCENNF